jgi:ABC-type uncharacterized transport system fused permease/ATPase subunit
MPLTLLKKKHHSTYSTFSSLIKIIKTYTAKPRALFQKLIKSIKRPLNIIQSIIEGFETLKKYCDKKIRRKTWRHITVYFFFQSFVTILSYFSTKLVDTLYSSLKEKNPLKFREALASLVIVSFCKTSLKLILGWGRQFIQSNWLQGLRNSAIKKLFGHDGRHFIKMQKIPSENKNESSIHTSQIIIQDFDRQVYTTLVAASQLFATLCDMIVNSYFLYTISPNLLIVGLAGSCFSLLSFLAFDKMSQYFNKCLTQRNKLQMDIDNTLSSWPTLLTSGKETCNKFIKNIQKEIETMNEYWKGKIWWDRLGRSTTAFIRAFIIPIACITLSPSYFSGEITFGQFQVAIVVLRNLFESLTVLTTDIQMYANFQSTNQRCAQLQSILDKKSPYPIHRQPDTKDEVIKLDKVIILKDKTTKLLQLPHTLTVKKGERVLLTGPNGRGKSQLFQALIGAIQKDPPKKADQLHYYGTINITQDYIAALQQQASVTRTYPIDANKTITHKYLIESVMNYPIPKHIIEFSKEKLELDLNTKINPKAGSGGETSKHDIIRILSSLTSDTANLPKLILMDEITASLNETSKQVFYNKLDEELNKLKEQAPAVVWISHSDRKKIKKLFPFTQHWDVKPEKSKSILEKVHLRRGL